MDWSIPSPDNLSLHAGHAISNVRQKDDAAGVARDPAINP
jgi:hypothetical protein